MEAPLYRKLDEEKRRTGGCRRPEVGGKKESTWEALGRERDEREREGGSRMNPEITYPAHNTVWYHIDS